MMLNGIRAFIKRKNDFLEDAIMMYEDLTEEYIEDQILYGNVNEPVENIKIFKDDDGYYGNGLLSATLDKEYPLDTGNDGLRRYDGSDLGDDFEDLLYMELDPEPDPIADFFAGSPDNDLSNDIIDDGFDEELAFYIEYKILNTIFDADHFKQSKEPVVRIFYVYKDLVFTATFKRKVNQENQTVPNIDIIYKTFWNRLKKDENFIGLLKTNKEEKILEQDYRYLPRGRVFITPIQGKKICHIAICDCIKNDSSLLLSLKDDFKLHGYKEIYQKMSSPNMCYKCRKEQISTYNKKHGTNFKSRNDPPPI